MIHYHYKYFRKLSSHNQSQSTFRRYQLTHRTNCSGPRPFATQPNRSHPFAPHPDACNVKSFEASAVGTLAPLFFPNPDIRNTDVKSCQYAFFDASYRHKHGINKHRPFFVSRLYYELSLFFRFLGPRTYSYFLSPTFGSISFIAYSLLFPAPLLSPRFFFHSLLLSRFSPAFPTLPLYLNILPSPFPSPFSLFPPSPPSHWRSRPFARPAHAFSHARSFRIQLIRAFQK